MLDKKVTYFVEFGYLNSSCITQSIILVFLSSSREPIGMGSNMASPYKSLQIWVKHFSEYLV